MEFKSISQTKKPRPGSRLRFQELQKHLRHLLPAKHGWVHPIRAEILARPNQSILAALDAVSPHVRSPRHPWEPYSAARRVVIIFREACNLVGDDPLRSEAA